MVIVDEAQDLSANQIRAIMHFVADQSCVVFVSDTAQRIYKRGFTWNEVGILVRPNMSRRLTNNYRNTKQICEFARPILNGLNIEDDSNIPNFSSSRRDGPKPVIVEGLYNQQVKYVLENILAQIDLSQESAAFLKPRGRGWFRTIRQELRNNSIEYIELTRSGDCPNNSVNVALSTMHSAKGLEFDHVIIIGLSDQVTPHGN